MCFLTATFLGCTGDPIENKEKEKKDYAYQVANGAIIGYAAGWANAPSEAQLSMVTHVMVFQTYPTADGGLTKNHLPKWSIADFVTLAHGKGVKVSIVLGGWDNKGAGTQAFASITANPALRETFVNNVVNFADSLNLDGIDVDWEYPEGAAQWTNFISLCEELKQARPNLRISTALPGQDPNAYVNVVKTRIWKVLDAIHIMSYDMAYSWPTHSDAERSKQLIDAWANWGIGQENFDKRKLILGCAFYGYGVNDKGESIQIAYNQGGGTGTDTPASLKQKVDHCYDNGYGGVMIWELSQDRNISTTPELLNAIYQANNAKGGYTGK